jgi:hypothetical protein
VPQLDELLGDPCWFPTALDSGAGTIRFGHIDRDTLASESFLDERMHGAITRWESASLSAVVSALESEQRKAPPFVFHTAFCCSTLLARALDQPGVAFALKEPDILMSLANALRVDEQLQQSPARMSALVRTVFGLLGRRFTADELVLIKPTNSANNLIPYAVETGARVILLYGGLRDYLISVLKKGEACKSFVRQQYNIFALDPKGLGAIPQRQAVAFTDLQACAMVWRHQMELFQRVLSSAPQGQVASLEFTSLLDAPAAVLGEVARHLELDHSEAALESVACGEIFSKNSKFADQEYSADQREQDASLIGERYAEALDLIENWAAQLNLGEDLRLPLSCRLMP